MSALAAKRRRPLAVSLAAVLIALLVLPSVAGAANRRLSISNYQWSDNDVNIDLGEHVTWYWVGPDTMHSITGVSDNALQWDSDPGTNQPRHQVGDTFELDFDKPGTYSFRCKLHSTVRGTVTVSDKPGNPNAEPDPVPQSQVDLKAPHLDGPTLNSYAFGRKGTAMHYSLNEKARMVVDYYMKRPGKTPKYAGYAGWKAGHVGFNNVRFGVKRKHFKAKPGKYFAKVVATDQSVNSTHPRKIDFKIFKRKHR